MRAYWAAWGELLILLGDVLQEMKPFVLRTMRYLGTSLLLLGWIFGIAWMAGTGQYWQAAASFFGSLALGFLIAGHIAARAIMSENSELERSGGDGA